MKTKTAKDTFKNGVGCETYHFEAWVVVHCKSGRLTVGDDSTTRMFCSQKPARQFAKELAFHIGKCKSVKAQCHIFYNV